MQNPGRTLVCACLAASCLPVYSRAAMAGATGDAQPLRIGSRLELFVDDWLIDRMTGLSLKLHAPRPAEVALRFDKPWEGEWSASGYGTVFRDGNIYRMYYRAGLAEAYASDPESVCYAQSTDGVRWTKPELGLFEFEGSKKNNIVWKGVASPHALGVFKDTNPNCDPVHRYKALSSDGYRKPVYAFGSPDGIRWDLIQEAPVIAEYDGAVAAYDSQFCARWDPVSERYVVYHRIWYRASLGETPCVAELRTQPFFTPDYQPLVSNGKVRSVAMRTSEDFIHWSPLRRVSFGDTPPEHIYTNAIAPYFRAPHILLGFPRRFWPQRRRLPQSVADGVSDTVFISSRDGLHFDRRFMESFIRPGRDRLSWLSRCNTVLPGMLHLAPDELSLYLSRRWGDASVHVRRYVIRVDGFVSVNAKYDQGTLLTKPIVFEGEQLVLNYATSAAGFIAVEIQDASGHPIPGFSLQEGSFKIGRKGKEHDADAHSVPQIYGDEIEHVVSWRGGSDVGALAGKSIRLRFVMKDADLYSIRFKDRRTE